MFIPRIDWNVAMRIDEKSILTNIVEQVAIIQPISFLPGSSVYVRIVQKEHNFFFFHNDPSCSEYESHGLFSSVVLEAPPILLLNCYPEETLHLPFYAYLRS